MGTAPIFQPRQKNWFQRHMGLTIAGGCSVLIGIVLLFVCAILFFVFGLIRKSDATKMAVERAQANPIVMQKIGRPLEMGWLISGSVNVTEASGHADLAIPVSGDKGKGTIYAVADKSAGLWTFTTLQVAFPDNSPRVDLLQPAPEQSQ